MSFHTITRRFLRLLPIQRRVLLIAADALLLPLAVWLSFWLRLSEPFPSMFANSLWLVPAAMLLGIPLYAITGQYKGLTRYATSRSLYQLGQRNGVLVLLLFVTGGVLQLPMPPRSSWLLLWLLLTGSTSVLRFGLRDLLMSLQSTHRTELTRVAIYGAGSAGGQLATSLRAEGRHTVELFLDDAPHLWNREINGIPIQPPQILRGRRGDVDQVLLAIPSLSRRRRREIVDALQATGIPVLQVPSIEEITTGRARIDALRPIAIEELLGRDPVPPNPMLLGPGIQGCSVCVTGAGGSIGSELCRQILELKPVRLVLFELSEPSLYTINQELQPLRTADIEIVAVLGNAANASVMQRCFRDYQIESVFHAAAYKHVPLVEANPLAGLANNVIATRAVCNAARICGVRQMVLVSTDKAVRPTNVMGASKRLAELVVQAQPPSSTRFAMVRFGNVLGSSGSVVPLFRKQIATGGPVTLTHENVMRYFMTIPEAAQLVLQAATLSKGGDVFLLDMGEPVRIMELAKQMIHLSGLSVYSDSHPQGDIEIICTGLRPGEKLYEELLIDADCERTDHPLIYRARERFLPADELWPQIETLETAINNQDPVKALQILAKLVPEWKQS